MDELEYGKYIVLLDEKGKKWLIKLSEGGIFHTHKGRIYHEEILKAGYGGEISSDKGYHFYVLKPTIYDYIIKTPRPTQIVYPKDIGYLILKLGIHPGTRILEVGMGSGAFTSAILTILNGEGHIDAYERREDIMWSTIKYLNRIGVDTKILNIHKTDFLEASPPKNYYDIAIVDIDEPWKALDRVYLALKNSGRVGFIVPTYNQLDKLAEYIGKRFTDIEAIEISYRELQFKKGRIRPRFRMIGFTTVVVTAAKIKGGEYI